METRSKSARLLYSLAMMLENGPAHTYKKFNLRTALKLVIEVVGFGCLTVAGFQWDTIAGFIVAGLSCFAFSWHIGGSEDAEAQIPNRTIQRR